MRLARSSLRFKVLSKKEQDFPPLRKRRELALKVEFFFYGVLIGVLLSIVIAVFSM